MFHQPYRLRILFVLGLFGAALVALIVRLALLQIVWHDYYVREAFRYQIRKVPIRPKRGNIYDRNRRPLAVSVLLPTLYADTHLLPANRTDLAVQLGRILDRPAENIFDILNRRGRLPVERTMSAERFERIHNFLLQEGSRINGLRLERETKREYPQGRLACHVVGFTTYDRNCETSGLAGLEHLFDAEMRGNYKKYQVLRDAQSNLLTPLDDIYWGSAYGNELVLTLDASIQHVAETVLRAQIARYRARCGVIVVQRCRTGEILAMASFPDFDPSAFGAADGESHTNRVIAHAFGMGSVMKVFTAAALIETGALTNLDEPINCHNGVGYFPARPIPIHDAPGHELGIVPFRDVFRFSSNVGMVEAALRLDRHAYSRILDGFGFGWRTGIDLPKEAAGVLRPVSQWTPMSMLALPYGAEMSVTPIQLATAVSAVANGGLLMRPYVVREIRSHEGRLIHRTEPKVRRRVISPVAAQQVLELMEDVVGHPTADGRWEGGTGREAAIPGYRVGGKTGTFRWVVPHEAGERPTSYTASFVAILPLPDPELTIFCSIDEPHGEKYGGAIAAPAVRQVAEHALRILGIPPHRIPSSPANVQATIHRVRDTGRVARQATPRGQMPDLRNLTMREVHDCLAGLDIQVSFEGSGVVVAQEPAPLTSLQGVRECRVAFDRPGADR